MIKLVIFRRISSASFDVLLRYNGDGEVFRLVLVQVVYHETMQVLPTSFKIASGNQFFF